MGDVMFGRTGTALQLPVVIRIARGAAFRPQMFVEARPEV